MKELERCDAEIAEALRHLSSGAGHEDELWTWLTDWRMERELIQGEGEAQPNNL